MGLVTNDGCIARVGAPSGLGANKVSTRILFAGWCSSEPASRNRGSRGHRLPSLSRCRMPTARRRTHEMMTALFSRPLAAADVRTLDPPAASRLAEVRVQTLVLVGGDDWRLSTRSRTDSVARFPLPAR